MHESIGVIMKYTPERIKEEYEATREKSTFSVSVPNEIKEYLDKKAGEHFGLTKAARGMEFMFIIKKIISLEKEE